MDEGRAGSEIADPVAYLADARAALLQAVRPISAESGSRRPAPDAWSVAEVLEHLTHVERGVTRLLAGFVEQVGAEGTAPPPPADAGSRFVALPAVLDRRTRVEAIDVTRPRNGWTVDRSLAELNNAREALVRLVRAAATVDLGPFTFAHPYLGPLNGYDWIIFIGTHEMRHTEQIREIHAALERGGTSRTSG